MTLCLRFGIKLCLSLATERRTRDLTDIGIPQCYLSKMCEEELP